MNVNKSVEMTMGDAIGPSGLGWPQLGHSALSIAYSSLQGQASHAF